MVLMENTYWLLNVQYDVKYVSSIFSSMEESKNVD